MRSLAVSISLLSTPREAEPFLRSLRPSTDLPARLASSTLQESLRSRRMRLGARRMVFSGQFLDRNVAILLVSRGYGQGKLLCHRQHCVSLIRCLRSRAVAHDFLSLFRRRFSQVGPVVGLYSSNQRRHVPATFDQYHRHHFCRGGSPRPFA